MRNLEHEKRLKLNSFKYHAIKVGNPTKLPAEMVKFIPNTVVKGTEKAYDETKKAVNYVIPGSKKDGTPVDYDPKESIRKA